MSTYASFRLHKPSSLQIKVNSILKSNDTVTQKNMATLSNWLSSFWHFCHLNHIWEILFLKTASLKEIFCSYYLKEFLQLGTIFFTKQTSITVLLTKHISKSTMITFLSGCQVLFFPGLPFFSLCSPNLSFSLFSQIHHTTFLLFHLHSKQVKLDFSTLLLIDAGESHYLLLS